MKINDKHVIEEIQLVRSDVQSAYNYSSNHNCDRYLAKVLGRLETLVLILSNAEEE